MMTGTPSQSANEHQAQWTLKSQLPEQDRYLKISLVTPTIQRDGFHSRITKRFGWQTYAGLQRTIPHDSNTASKLSSGLDWKNVRCSHISETMFAAGRGDWLTAHFDDDDFYGPDYPSTLAFSRVAQSSGLMNQRGWFANIDRMFPKYAEVRAEEQAACRR